MQGRSRIYPPPARDDEPITMDWLDACGVDRFDRGPSKFYLIGSLEIEFCGPSCFSAWLYGGRMEIETRQDLRDLLRLMGAEPLKEAK